MQADEIRRIERMRKLDLIDEVLEWGRRRGRVWVLGGPSEWSKAELVTSVIRIREGGEA